VGRCEDRKEIRSTKLEIRNKFKDKARMIQTDIPPSDSFEL